MTGTTPITRPTAPPGGNATPADYSVMVLLVDDQVMVAEAIRRCLANQPNIDFHYCIDPTEAVRLANQIKPTVILQDLVMPGIDGLTLVRQFRANPGTQETPIIVLSTKEEPTIKAQAFAAGANDYLVKLPDKVELIARIRYHSKAYQSAVQRDEAYRALRESQQQLFGEMTSYFDPVPVRRVPMFREEVVGLAALDRLADVLETLDPDPARVTRSASAYTFTRRDGVHQVRVSMPFASKAEVGLFKKGDELVIEVGVIRRHVGLPQSIAALHPRRARFEDDVLVVDLGEAV